MANFLGDFDILEPSGKYDSLLPCPFCGNSDSIRYVISHKVVGDRFSVCCFNCMAEVDPGYLQSKHDASRRWNTRNGKCLAD